jgi:DNA polymerase-1
VADRDQDLASRLRQAGVERGDLVALAVAPGGTVAVAGPQAGWIVTADEVAAADAALRPRWVTWSGQAASRLCEHGVRLSTSWDIAAVHRLLFGGWHAGPGLAWARIHGLAPGRVAAHDPGTLFDAVPEEPPRAAPPSDDPIGPGGYLSAEWTDGGWADSRSRMLRWAHLAQETARLQSAALSALSGTGGGLRLATARSESTAELLCAELAADGLPFSLAEGTELLTEIIGPRPRHADEAARIRATRDELVLRHAPEGVTADLRSPLQVRALLRSAGIDVPDTRAWRLEPFAGTHPLVAALLEWRKAERIATTYGYGWLDACLGTDQRLRGAWTGCDGAAGRMTASAGLHNMPAILRKAVIAEDGHVFVRADLGQIEPRVLAAVSGDPALIAATEADDLYLPVAGQLGVDRPTAKVAMIAAMYGQTTGHGGQAAKRMKAAYPVAMGYLDGADRQARAGRDLRTYGGRLVLMSGGTGDTGGDRAASAEPAARVAGRGRYGRNAMIQGAAAELFKMWAVTVRARGAALDARIVLCLHDELLVHVPEHSADAAARLVDECLAETARRWAPGPTRFLAEITIVRCWADAKPATREGMPVTGTDTVS